MQKVIKKMIGFKVDFLLILGGFWEGFGRVWGTKLGASWGQVGLKINTKRYQKKNEKKIAS